MVDKPKLDQMLSNLRRYVGVLEGLAGTPARVFLADPDKIKVGQELVIPAA